MASTLVGRTQALHDEQRKQLGPPDAEYTCDGTTEGFWHVAGGAVVSYRRPSTNMRWDMRSQSFYSAELLSALQAALKCMPHV